MKKIFVLALSVVTAITALNITAVASEPSGEVLSDLYNFNIIADISDVRANDNVTRAEVVKMLCFMEGYREEDMEGNIQEVFSDVPPTHWAAKYIATGYFENIIQGYGDNTFQPERNVTYQELQKMIVSALGYDLYAQNAGGYPDGYIMYAASLGLTENLIFENNDFATRGDTMQMIYNALDAPIMVVQRMFIGEEETEPVIMLYDGGNYPFRSYRMMLNGEVEY